MRARTRPLTAVQAILEQIGISYLAGRFRHENVSTVSSWKARSSIPLAYWPVLIEAAQAKGIDLDEAALVRIHLAPDSVEAQQPDRAAPHAA